MAKPPNGYRIKWGGPCNNTSRACRFTARTEVVTLNIKPPAKKSKK